MIMAHVRINNYSKYIKGHVHGDYKSFSNTIRFEIRSLDEAKKLMDEWVDQKIDEVREDNAHWRKIDADQ